MEAAAGGVDDGGRVEKALSNADCHNSVYIFLCLL